MTFWPECGAFRCPDSDPDQCQKLMRSKLDQDSSSNFNEILTSSICVILLTNKQTIRKTKGHENNNSLAEVSITRRCSGFF